MNGLSVLFVPVGKADLHHDAEHRRQRKPGKTVLAVWEKQENHRQGPYGRTEVSADLKDQRRHPARSSRQATCRTHHFVGGSARSRRATLDRLQRREGLPTHP
jgi:hypothetical protein